MSFPHKRLVTAALPYVNNIPHLGNLVQVLSADAYARFCRSYGYETIYVCGTDEYGTATETKALQERKNPKDLCDEFYVIHKQIYEWFSIKFDIFGRTSTPEQTEIVQDLFLELDKEGYITQHENNQFFCETCLRFLADRFIEGICPHCDYPKAKGDQCEKCGHLLNPTELKEPHCTICQKTPILKQTRNLYINLPKIEPKIREWIKQSQIEENWSSNATLITQKWLKEGLQERAITRDLKWGVPVPKEGFQDKVFYVWFDAVIGYISLTKRLTPEWEKWWQEPKNTKVINFVGKDNVPFHSILFPSILLASKRPWSIVNQLAASEYLNYENTKFSKSLGTGIFGNDVQETGIPSDVWRYYLFIHRPEKADTSFLWHDFAEKVNADLIGNLGNFINRTLSFHEKYFGYEVPPLKQISEIWKEISDKEEIIIQHLEKTELKSALKTIMSLSDLANKSIQHFEPWKVVKTDSQKVQKFLINWIYVIKHIAILIEPFMPKTSSQIFNLLNTQPQTYCQLKEIAPINSIKKPQVLFEKLEKEHVENLKQKYSGKQQTNLSLSLPTSCQAFHAKVSLKVMQIIEVSQHPEADKLFILKLKEDEENLTQRTIVSGLVGIYSASELLNQKIIVVANLKKSKLRGVVSEGMLTAVNGINNDCEVLMAPDNISIGTRVVLKDFAQKEIIEPTSLKASQFFEIPIVAQQGNIVIEDIPLVFHKTEIPVRVKRILNGDVG